MTNAYVRSNNYLKSTNIFSLYAKSREDFSAPNSRRIIARVPLRLISEVPDMAIKKQTNKYELIEKLKTIKEKFNGRDDEPITGNAAEEFALEAKLHLERYEFLSDWLIEELTKQSQVPRLILDVGCGPGILTQIIAQNIIDSEVLGVDISTDMLQIAERDTTLNRINFVHGDARKVPEVVQRPVDAIISRRMIHRVDDLEKTLESIAKTLKTGGVMLNYSFRKPMEAADQTTFLEDAAQRSEFSDLYAAFIRAVLNAPTVEEYNIVCKRIAHKLDLKHYAIKVFPYDVGIVFVR